MMKKHESVNRRIIDSISLINQALDEALLSMTAAHQKFTLFDSTSKAGDRP